MDNKVSIIEYDENLAGDIAEMWSHSEKGWNGFTWNATEQSVRNEENNSSHLQLVLAETDGLVAGYCKLSVDHWDSGALYIDLLNVRDDYHGKKIGKELVLNAVRKTIELKWPRVDLYTWGGNLKAVPLYKKCGFFWEKRDDSTHLINLIPTVLQTELFESYFQETDWYDDSTRKIEVKPDDNIQNKFTYWTYSWDKDGNKLEIDFARRGRGIRRIENNDFSITVTVEDLNLVFGRDYEIKYEVVNKSGKELYIELNGENDKNIIFDFQKEISIENEEVITANFHVGPVKEIQLEKKTHPCVVTNMKINGKKVVFKTGIMPQFPLNLKLADPLNIPVANIKNDLYLNVENNFNENADFSIQLPECKEVEIEPKSINVTLNAKEKKSLLLSSIVRRTHFYSENINIDVKLENTEVFGFSNEISTKFKTGYGSYFGEDRTCLDVGSGNYFLTLSKEQLNEITFGISMKKDLSVTLKPPKIGLPFTDEFQQKLYEKYETEKGDGWIILKLHYKSDNYQGIDFIKILKLYENGILEKWYEFTNNSDKESQEVWVNDGIRFNQNYLVFSYDGKFIHLEDDNTFDLECWDTGKFDENWMISDTGNGKLGISWSNEFKPKILEETLLLVSNIGILKPGESRISKSIINTIDAFSDWKLFREFVTGKKHKDEVLIPAVEFNINSGNPFFKEELSAKFILHSSEKINGEIFFKADRMIDNPQGKKMKDGATVQFTAMVNKPINISEICYKKTEFEKKVSKVAFKVGENDIRTSEVDGILSIDNGIISIESSRNFAPSIHSLKYMGEEWLETNYPEITPKAWWNPWVGGLFSFPQEFSIQSLLEEDFTTEVVEKSDNKGNIWTGLKITIDMVKKEEKKGFKYSQYYLLMPGVPLLMTFCEFSRQGEYTEKIVFESEHFFKGKEKLTSHYIEYNSGENKPMRFNSGVKSVDNISRGMINLFDEDRSEHISQYNTDKDKNITGYYISPELTLLWLENSSKGKAGETAYTKPVFTIFDEEKLDEDMLIDLKDIRFS